MLEKLIDLLLSMLCSDSATGVKISSSLKGTTIFIPWILKIKTAPVPSMASGDFAADPKVLTDSITLTKRPASTNATSPLSSRIVTLSSEELRREKDRILDIARRSLSQDGKGELRLMPWLHLTLCWEIIRHLRCNGISVKPNSYKDAVGRIKFFFEDDGTLVLWFRNSQTPPVEPTTRQSHNSYAIATNPGRTFLPPADWQTEDDLGTMEGGSADHGEDPAAEKLRADIELAEAEPRASRRDKNRYKPAGGDIGRILQDVKSDLKSRGVDRLPLDLSLIRPTRAHLGSRFFKKSRREARDGKDLHERA